MKDSLVKTLEESGYRAEIYDIGTAPGQYWVKYLDPFGGDLGSEIREAGSLEALTNGSVGEMLRNLVKHAKVASK